MTRAHPPSSPLPFRVLVLTDEDACRRMGRGVVETVARAVLPHAAGCAVLVRARARPPEDTAALCRTLRPITSQAGALLLVHTHVALVGELGLDGAHLASTTGLEQIAGARAELPPRALLGASRHAQDALDAGALRDLDYVTLSPVFKPSSKPGDDRATLGCAGLARHAASAARPLVALGGISAHAAPDVLRSGAAAIAVLGDVMGARDPRQALRALLDGSTQAARARASRAEARNAMRGAEES